MSRPDDINERDHFNHWSETYEHHITQWLFFDRVHRGVLRRVPKSFTPAAVLDIGCGTGRLLRWMQNRWPSAVLTGVDLAEGMVAQARTLTPDATIYQAPAEHLPLESESVDLVTSTVSFHHWSDQARGVGEAARVLRPRGLFVLADLRIAHGHPLSLPRVRTLFENAGLSIRSQDSPLLFFVFSVGEKLEHE
jgi:ubiquinone/menaquinone biosynthesis C-methylase UbiE